MGFIDNYHKRFVIVVVMIILVLLIFSQATLKIKSGEKSEKGPNNHINGEVILDSREEVSPSNNKVVIVDKRYIGDPNPMNNENNYYSANIEKNRIFHLSDYYSDRVHHQDEFNKYMNDRYEDYLLRKGLAK